MNFCDEIEGRTRRRPFYHGILWALVLLAGSCVSRSKEAFSEKYLYDGDGRLVSKVASDGSRTVFAYDQGGLLTGVECAGYSVDYEYDENRNRVRMKDTTGSTEYFYDAFIRLEGVLYNHEIEQLIVYAHNPWGDPVRVTIFNLGRIGQDPEHEGMLKELKAEPRAKMPQYQDRRLQFRRFMEKLRSAGPEKQRLWIEYIEYNVDYQYDILGNLAYIDTKWGRISYVYHFARGQVERRLPNGITTRLSFSPEGHLTALRHEDSAEQLIAEYRYEYNTAGKITYVHEQSPESLKTYRYVWDSRGYLKEFHRPDGTSVRFQYDAMGNRIMKRDSQGTLRYEYDRYGRLVKAGNLSLQWDRNGYLISKDDGRQKIKIESDGRGLPIQIRLDGSSIRYKWDDAGNLVSRFSEKETTHFLPDPLAPADFTLAEYDRAGRRARSYIYGDVLLGQADQQNRIQYFLEDGFNSIRQISDENGRIVSQCDYNPFGEIETKKGNLPFDFRMRGERFLPELDSYLIGRRFYDTRTARYLTPDPYLGYADRFDSFNEYAPSCSSAGIFMEPRCNQTKKKSVLVGGVGARLPQIMDEAFRFGFDIGLPVGSGWGGFFGLLKLYDFEWAAWDQVTGGFLTSTKQNLLERLIRVKYISTLAVHSWGAITLGNLHEKLDLALKDGSLFIDEVIFLGAEPNEELRAVLRKHNIPYRVLYAFPGGGKASYAGRFLDPVPVWTKTNMEIGEELFPGIWDPVQWLTGGLVKFGTLLLMIPTPFQQFSGKAHELGYLLEKKDKKKSDLLPRPRRREQDKFFWKRQDYYPPPPYLFGGAKIPVNPSILYDPLEDIQKQIGGVQLRASAEFLGDLGRIAGAVYDPIKQCLVLIGDKNQAVPSIKIEDLAVALKLVFGESLQEPQFSLDPADPKNPKGRWLKAVYWPEDILRSTDFGKALFEADWLLKQYSLGVKLDETGKKLERKSSVSGFKTVADLCFEDPTGESGREQWARFWIVSDEMKLKKTADGIGFAAATMRVKARKQVVDPSSPTGLKDVDTEDDPVATKFANIFTDLYDKIAEESLEFERVRELAKAVALAKWIKEKDIPLDLSWIDDFASKPVETVDRITGLSVEWRKEYQKPFSKIGQTGIQTIIHQLQIFGGVDLRVKPKYIPDDGSVRSFQEVVFAHLKKNNPAPKFPIEWNGSSLRGVVLPVTKTGREILANSRAMEVEGTLYQFNDRNEISRSIAQSGVVTEYEYNADHELAAVAISDSGNRRIEGLKEGEGSLWTVTSSGSQIKYKYDKSGYLNEIEVAGRTWAQYEFVPQQRRISIRYDGCAENIVFDNQGRIHEYEIGSSKDSISRPEFQKLAFGYDKAGNLNRITEGGVPLLEISYDERGVNLISLRSPLEQIRLSYSDGLLREIRNLSGRTVKIDSTGDNFWKMIVGDQDQKAEYSFNENGISQSIDFHGGITDYGYQNGRLISVKNGYGEIRYVYDGLKRLKEIRLPSKSWIEFRYEDKNREKNASDKVMILTKIYHPIL